MNEMNPLVWQLVTLFTLFNGCFSDSSDCTLIPEPLGQDSLLYDEAPESAYEPKATLAEGKWLVNITVNQSDCLVELFTIRRLDSIATDYYQTGDMVDKQTKMNQKFPAYNQGTLPSRWCAKAAGIYGATIPVYRYRYGLNDHLLATPDGALVDEFKKPLYGGYLQNFNDYDPICYIWPTEHVRQIGAEIKCPMSAEGLPLADLWIYSNTHDPNLMGTGRLDFQTGVAPLDSDRYRPVKRIGRVLAADKHNCSCAKPLHTFVNSGVSLNSAYDSLISVSETLSGYSVNDSAVLKMHCVLRAGQCGASLELKAYFNLAAQDMYISLRDDHPITYASVRDVNNPSKSTLCYVWN